MKKNRAWKGIKGVLGNLEAAFLNRGSGGTSLSLSLGTDIQERKGEPRSYCGKENLAEEGPGQLSVTGSLLGVRETGQEGNGDANCVGQVGQVKMWICSQ